MLAEIRALLEEREIVKKAKNAERLAEINRTLERLAANAKTPAERAARRITKGPEKR